MPSIWQGAVIADSFIEKFRRVPRSQISPERQADSHKVSEREVEAVYAPMPRRQTRRQVNMDSGDITTTITTIATEAIDTSIMTTLLLPLVLKKLYHTILWHQVRIM